MKIQPTRKEVTKMAKDKKEDKKGGKDTTKKGK